MSSKKLFSFCVFGFFSFHKIWKKTSKSCFVRSDKRASNGLRRRGCSLDEQSYRQNCSAGVIIGSYAWCVPTLKACSNCGGSRFCGFFDGGFVDRRSCMSAYMHASGSGYLLPVIVLVDSAASSGKPFTTQACNFPRRVHFFLSVASDFRRSHRYSRHNLGPESTGQQPSRHLVPVLSPGSDKSKRDRTKPVFSAVLTAKRISGISGHPQNQEELSRLVWGATQPFLADEERKEVTFASVAASAPPWSLGEVCDCEHTSGAPERSLIVE